MASVDPTITTTIAAANSEKTAWAAAYQVVATFTAGLYLICDTHHSWDQVSDQILSGLDPTFYDISATIRARDSTIIYEELYEKLLDHELFLRHEEFKKAPNQITDATATSNNFGHSNSRNTHCPNNSNGNQ
ncbi:uncharacterized protein LOC129903555 [Solanum dulcamara]|uniref:uncharacterized protein LOC129903555 n=1 Tax=Solanum dulcamara TaxID=45834 RepID=UPI002486AE0F|nr:uncharacterized protein LOC129903555 [Solanum dulcamara]